jgi:hypothetical protein
MAPLGTLAFCRKTGKLGYMDENHANDAARRLLRRFGYFRPYHCEHCGWWHLTKKPWRRGDD